MKYYLIAEPGGNWITSDDLIIRDFFPFWERRMKKANKEYLISKKTCIEDFTIVHWASEIMLEFNEAGFLLNREDWTPEVMRFIAEREKIELTEDVEKYVMLARKLYDENGTVPVLREFSKLTGGDRKGTHLNKLFNGGPMKKIAMLAGLPQPTGCV